VSSVKLDTGGLAITQVAAVVRDLRSSLEAYHKALGWGPWNVYEHKPPMLHSTELHGKPTEFTMLGAECHAGPIVFELLQPLEGPSIYKEWLDEHGEGLHHVAVMVPTHEQADQTRAHFQELGAEVLMGGRIGETIEFYYIETMPQLKFVLESGSGHAIELKPVRQYPPA
jgi:methylmalonyl-CoA/ethylmalonyl-CoA epimerase